ncbi:MAG: glycine zipper domain-containing protein [Beijerinckiaceae bacterium]
MKKTFMNALAITIIAGGLSACYSPGDRAVGGAVLGGASGALIGGALGGGRGALLGGGIGAASGAIIGANTRPQPVYVEERPVYVSRAPRRSYYSRRPVCPYGAYEDFDGSIYCR